MKNVIVLKFEQCKPAHYCWESRYADKMAGNVAGTAQKLGPISTKLVGIERYVLSSYPFATFVSDMRCFHSCPKQILDYIAIQDVIRCSFCSKKKHHLHHRLSQQQCPPFLTRLVTQYAVDAGSLPDSLVINLFLPSLRIDISKSFHHRMCPHPSRIHFPS